MSTTEAVRLPTNHATNGAVIDLTEVALIDLTEVRARPVRLPTVTVVIPTKNEAENLPHVLPHIPAWVDEIIIVDALSHDGTREVAKEMAPSAIIIIEPRAGKGRALCAGFERATSDFVIAIDADGSTDPREIPAFVGALEAGADFVKGSRFLQGGGTNDMEGHRRWGNRLLTLMVNRLFGARYSDLCYGFFGFRRAALTSLVKSDDEVVGFEIETFLNIRALASELRVTEVASFEHERIHGTSNLNAIVDGVRIARVIFAETVAKLRTRR